MRTGRPPRKFRDRFFDNVPPYPDAECWNWRGSILQKSGYGRIYAGGTRGKWFLAHRASWIIHFGHDPGGLMVLHRCDNRLCVNPSHLFLGTARDNMDDKVAKGRQSRMVGERNPTAKLKDDNIIEIRKRYLAGESQKKIGESFGVCQTVIGQIVRRKRWAHVI